MYERIDKSIYLVHLYFGHVVMSSSNHTRYSHVHVNHNRHRNEKGTHGREHHVAFVLIVSALANSIFACVIVPGGWEMGRVFLIFTGELRYKHMQCMFRTTYFLLK